MLQNQQQQQSKPPRKWLAPGMCLWCDLVTYRLHRREWMCAWWPRETHWPVCAFWFPECVIYGEKINLGDPLLPSDPPSTAATLAGLCVVVERKLVKFPLLTGSRAKGFLCVRYPMPCVLLCTESHPPEQGQRGSEQSVHAGILIYV